jgi:hypothetical protein
MFVFETLPIKRHLSHCTVGIDPLWTPESILAEHLAGIGLSPMLGWPPGFASVVSIPRDDCPERDAVLYRVRVLLDDKPDENVRVIGLGCARGIRAFVPLTDSFIMSPKTKPRIKP